MDVPGVFRVAGRPPGLRREALTRLLLSQLAPVAGPLGHIVPLRHPVQPRAEGLGERPPDHHRLGLRELQRVLLVEPGQDAPDRVDVRVVVERAAELVGDQGEVREVLGRRADEADVAGMVRPDVSADVLGGLVVGEGLPLVLRFEGPDDLAPRAGRDILPDDDRVPSGPARRPRPPRPTRRDRPPPPTPRRTSESWHPSQGEKRPQSADRTRSPGRGHEIIAARALPPQGEAGHSDLHHSAGRARRHAIRRRHGIRPDSIKPQPLRSM